MALYREVEGQVQATPSLSLCLKVHKFMLQSGKEGMGNCLNCRFLNSCVGKWCSCLTVLTIYRLHWCCCSVPQMKNVGATRDMHLYVDTCIPQSERIACATGCCCFVCLFFLGGAGFLFCLFFVCLFVCCCFVFVFLGGLVSLFLLPGHMDSHTT